MSAFANFETISKLLSGAPKILWCSKESIEGTLPQQFTVIPGSHHDGKWIFGEDDRQAESIAAVDCAPVNCHVIVVDGDTTEQAIEQIKALWPSQEDAPAVLPASASADTIIAAVCADLLRRNKEVSQGYVQLRNQINELRREVEHTRVQHFDLEGYVNSLRMDRPRLAYTAAPSGKYIGDTNLSQDIKLRQLLPFRAKGIYGVDLNFLPTKNIGQGVLNVRLIAQEDDAVLAAWELNYDDCDGWVHFFFNAPCDMKYRFVDLEVSWTTYAGKAPRLSLAQTNNQGEAELRTVSGKIPGQMLAFKVWIATPGTALRQTKHHHFPIGNESEQSYSIPVDAGVLAKMRSTVPPASITTNFEWFNCGNPKDIFIHPLPNVAATVVVPMTFDSKVSMISTELFSSHEHGPEIEYLVCITPIHMHTATFPHKELNDRGQSMDPQVSSTGWITVSPDQLAHPLNLKLSLPMKSFNLHFAARSLKTVDYAHGHFLNTEIHFSRNAAKCL